MKKILFLMVLSMGILFFGHAANAQMKPMYQYTHYNNDGKSTSGADFHTALSHIAQWIYRPSDLLGLPAGPLRSVYFRIGITYGQYTPCPVVWDSMWVKMGYTQDSIYKDTIVNGMTGYYVLKSGLTTVFFQPKVTIFFDTANPIGTWVRFPIDGFSYRRDANLVVELSRTRQSYSNGFDWMMTNSCRGCYIGGYIGRPYSSWPSGDQADIGFNDSTASVGGLSTLKGFYAYPNPSQGLFTVGFEPSGGNASSVLVSVSDMAGRQVWQRSYQDVRADLFTANVDLRSRPKGIYLLRVQAGEAQALQRVVVE